MTIEAIVASQIVISKNPFIEARKVPFVYSKLVPDLISWLNQTVRKVAVDAVGRYEDGEWSEP